MPELPEVETIRRTLAQLVAGETIESVTVLLPKMVKKPLNTEAFVDALAGETIRSLGRRGKFLIFYTTIMHLSPICAWKGGTGFMAKMSRLKSIRI